MDILRGRLQASEGSHFKREQEDELKEYRRRRMKEGAITADEVATASSGPNSPLSQTPSEKLAEIHAQETRLSAPEDVLRRRVRAQMPPGDTTRRGVSAGAAWAAGHLPRTSLGRGRWSLPVADSASALPLAEETAAHAAQREVAQRALAAGTRALLYGSALALVGGVLAARAAAQAWGIEGEDDLRRIAADAVAPHALALRDSLAPAKAWLAARVGVAAAAGAEGGGDDVFAQQLRRTGAFRGLASAQAQRSAEPPALDAHDRS